MRELYFVYTPRSASAEFECVCHVVVKEGSLLIFDAKFVNLFNGLKFILFNMHKDGKFLLAAPLTPTAPFGFVWFPLL